MKLSFALLTLSGAVHQIVAHMEMVSPAPRRSKYNKSGPGPIDYDYTAPLGGAYSYPCRGYGAANSVATYQAGSSIPVTLGGGASHNGGHCQFAISYDDSTFVVLKTVMGTCMIDGLNYNVPLPSDAPNGKATLAWGWLNRSGNREYYMNCADITIQGGKDNGKISGKKLFVANLPGFPDVPEGFANNYGLDLINGQPDLVISPNGGANPAPPATSSQPKPEPSYPVTQPQPPVPTTQPESSYSTTPSQSQPPIPTTQPQPPIPTTQPQPPVPTTQPEPSSPTYSTTSTSSPTVPPVTLTESSKPAPPSYTESSKPAPPTYTESSKPPPTSSSNSGYPTSVPNVPSPEPQPPSDGSCSEGLLQCSGQNLQICSHGVFYPLGCPPGTTCQSSSYGASCL